MKSKGLDKSLIYKKKIPEFKIRKFKHFDFPITKQTEENVDKVYAWLNSPDEIAKHAFYPLISSTRAERKRSIIEQLKFYESLTEYEKRSALIEKLSNSENNINKEQLEEEILNYCEEKIQKFKEKGPIKERVLKKCSHADSLIYAHYTNILNKLYETKIKELGISDNVIAYRESKTKSVNNIDNVLITTATMYEVIEQIKEHEHNCYVLAFDLSSFFDTIDHAKLKEEWKKILNVESLPNDHYNIFKSLTKYCYVEQQDITQYITQFQQNKGSEGTKITFKDVFKSAKAFREFRKWCNQQSTNESSSTSKFYTNPNNYGLPQGIQISAVLSNIFMLPFDIKISELSKKYNLFYRRYSDDILLIVPRNENLKNEIITIIKESIKERGANLKLHPITTWNKYSKSQCYDFLDTKALKQKPLQYLGYYYDGTNVRIREASIANNRRKMHNAITYRKLRLMDLIDRLQKKDIGFLNQLTFSDLIKLTSLRRRSLYKKYTYRGKRNFITYALKSSKVLYGADSKNNSIKSQIHASHTALRKEIKDANKKIHKHAKNQIQKYKFLNENKDKILKLIKQLYNEK
jgi:hypothetical protein